MYIVDITLLPAGFYPKAAARGTKRENSRNLKKNL